MALVAKSTEVLPAVGSFVPAAYGVHVLSGTTGTVTFPQFSSVDAVFVSSSANACSAAVDNTTANPTVTITGTSTNIISYLAVGKVRL